jgi:DNA-binding CsgD family transcriptional regulator
MQSLDFSPQQARVIELILEGKPDKQIARQMGMSFGTLRTHLSRVYAKTGASGRMELAARVYARLEAIRNGKECPQKC